MTSNSKTDDQYADYTQYENLVSALISARKRIFTLPPGLTVSQWADAYRFLSQESSAEYGPWNTDRAPFQREMMDVVNDPLINRVVLMTSAQVGKTEVLNNILGFYISYDPSPVLYMQPTVDMAQTISKDRLAPMFRDTPILTERVSDFGSKKSGNTILHKTFPGGHITLCGANSPASLASRPIRVYLGDECDRYPASAGTEGDPIGLGTKRTVTFWNRKLIFTSTPTIKGISRIEKLFDESDQRFFWVPCPKCGEMQILKWQHVRWPKGEPEKARYECIECKSLINNRHKNRMLKDGKWIAEKETKSTAGFHINEIYSPWSSWPEMATNFIEAKKNIETLKAWTNTSLGKTFEERGDQPTWSLLQARCEPYQMMTVPLGGELLVAGVDTQDDRLAVVIRVFGQNEESWLVYHAELYGDTSLPDVWRQLDELLNKTYKRADGVDLNIVTMAIDSGGHRTQEVYNFVRIRHPRVIAVKGASTRNKPVLSKPTQQDVAYNGQKYKNGVQLWTLGVDTIKSTIYSRLKQKEKGQGYYHWPIGTSDEYFSQLTAEKIVTTYRKGFPIQEWVKTGNRRNEALDCEAYCYAAAVRSGLMVMNFDRNVNQQKQQKQTQPELHRRPKTKRGYSRPSWIDR